MWDYKTSVFGHCALTPWKLPDNKYSDTVVELAPAGGLFLFDLGYFKVPSWARIAAPGAYFFCRLNHQTNIFTSLTGQLQPLELTRFLKPVECNIVEQQIYIGATELVHSRLEAVRLPEILGNARRRIAKKKAKKKG